MLHYMLYGFTVLNLLSPFPQGEIQKPVTIAEQQIQTEKIITLDKCFEEALINNPELSQYKFNKESADYSIGLAKDSYKPKYKASTYSSLTERSSSQGHSSLISGTKSTTKVIEASIAAKTSLNGSISLSSSMTRSETQSNFQGISPSENSAFLGISLNQPLLRRNGKFFADYEINKAKLNSRISNLSLQKKINDLYIEISTLYFQTVKAKMNIKVYKSHLESMEKMLEMSKAKNKIGVGTKLEVSQNEVKVAEARSIFLQKKNEYENRMEILFNKIGISVPDNIILDEKLQKNIELPDIEMYKKNFPETRYDVMMAKYNMDIAKLELENSRNNLKTDLNLNASYGKAGYAQSIRKSFDLNDKQWTIRFETGLNSDKSSNRKMYNIKFNTYNSKKEIYRSTKLNAKLELNTVERNLQTGLERIKVLEKTFKQAEKNLSAAQSSYQKGITSIINVLDARNDLRDIRLNYNSALIDFDINLKNRKRVLGILKL